MVIGIIKLKYCLLAHSYDGRYPPFSLGQWNCQQRSPFTGEAGQEEGEGGSGTWNTNTPSLTK